MTNLDTNQIVEADIRELSAYGFDSDTQTLVGMGTGNSRSALRAAHFDSDDLTLVGMGPAERAERARRSRPIQPAPEPAALAQDEPERVRAPQSESPGPFIASDDDHEIPEALPLQRNWVWALALPALLAAAGALVVVRGFVPYVSAPRTLGAAIRAPQTAAAAAPPVESNHALTPQSTDAPPEPAAAAPVSIKKLPVAEPALGELDITSSPGASFVLDGRPFGKAPRVLQLAPGSHTVLFIHPERGRMSVTVNVRAGRTTSASADF